jgi:hypothetical protein
VRQEGNPFWRSFLKCTSGHNVFRKMPYLSLRRRLRRRWRSTPCPLIANPGLTWAADRGAGAPLLRFRQPFHSRYKVIQLVDRLYNLPCQFNADLNFIHPDLVIDFTFKMGGIVSKEP